MTYCVSTIEAFDSYDCAYPHRQRLPRSVFYAATLALGLVAGAWALQRDAAPGVNAPAQRMAAIESKPQAVLTPKIANRVGVMPKTKSAHAAKADVALLDPALLRLRPASFADSAPLDTKFPARQGAPAIQIARAEQTVSPPSLAELRRSDGVTTPTPPDRVTRTPATAVPEKVEAKIIEPMPVARPVDLATIPAPPRQVAQAELVTPLPPPAVADLRRSDNASRAPEHVVPAPIAIAPEAVQPKTIEPMPLARPADLPVPPVRTPPRQIAQAEVVAPLPPPAMADLRRDDSKAAPERVAPTPVAVAPEAVEPKAVEPKTVEPKTIEAMPQSRPADLPAVTVRIPERTPPRQVAHNRTIVPASPPADNRSFFDKLFGGQQSSNPALAYASPEDGTINNNRRLTGSPAASFDRLTAVYDISAHTVYLPNGTRLEAHSGLGALKDDPRYVSERMRGATPPQVYDLTPREQLFHGVQALRLNPVGGSGVYGRVGLLAHTYMLGPRGDSNGCVSFRDYQAFLRAYQNGEIRRLAVVAHL